jgi:hypothetical protein
LRDSTCGVAVAVQRVDGVTLFGGRRLPRLRATTGKLHNSASAPDFLLAMRPAVPAVAYVERLPARGCTDKQSIPVAAAVAASTSVSALANSCAPTCHVARLHGQRIRQRERLSSTTLPCARAERPPAVAALTCCIAIRPGRASCSVAAIACHVAICTGRASAGCSGSRRLHRHPSWQSQL